MVYSGTKDLKEKLMCTDSTKLCYLNLYHYENENMLIQKSWSEYFYSVFKDSRLGEDCTTDLVFEMQDAGFTNFKSFEE